MDLKQKIETCHPELDCTGKYTSIGGLPAISKHREELTILGEALIESSIYINLLKQLDWRILVQ